MKAVDLLTELADIVDDPGLSTTTLLLRLNDAQMAIAEDVFLPGLAGGVDTVVATSAGMSANVPATYHKRIYLAKNVTTGGAVALFDNIGLLARHIQGIPADDNEGDVSALTVHNGKILYQNVPTSDQIISLMFYRLPVAMTAASTSYPDGMAGARSAAKEAFDRAILNHAAWKCFERIEQGLDGRKVDTDHYENEFKRAMLEVKSACRDELVLPRAPVNRCW